MNPDPVIVEALNLLKANNSEKEQINNALKNYGTEKGLTNGLKKILKEVNVKIEAYHTGNTILRTAKNEKLQALSQETARKSSSVALIRLLILSRSLPPTRLQRPKL